jgi:hypothetical protein
MTVRILICTSMPNLPLEIVVARDDRAFRHRSMGGDHFFNQRPRLSLLDSCDN